MNSLKTQIHSFHLKSLKARLHSFAKKGASAVFATVVVYDKKDARFDEAKIAEIRELIQKGTYEIVKEEDVPHDATILQSRFVLTIKNFEIGRVLQSSTLHFRPHRPRETSSR